MLGEQGVTVDPGENFLLAGERDAQLRIWSLRTGEALPLRPLGGRSCEVRGEGQPIRALEMSEDDNGVSLWVGCENRICRVELGPRGLLMH